MGQMEIAHDCFQITVDDQLGPSDHSGQHRAGHAIGMVKGQGGENPLFCGNIYAGIAGIMQDGLMAEHNRLGGAGGS